MRLASSLFAILFLGSASADIWLEKRPYYIAPEGAVTCNDVPDERLMESMDPGKDVCQDKEPGTAKI